MGHRCMEESAECTLFGSYPTAMTPWGCWSQWENDTASWHSHWYDTTWRQMGWWPVSLLTYPFRLSSKFADGWQLSILQTMSHILWLAIFASKGWRLINVNQWTNSPHSYGTAENQWCASQSTGPTDLAEEVCFRRRNTQSVRLTLSQWFVRVIEHLRRPILSLRYSTDASIVDLATHMIIRFFELFPLCSWESFAYPC